MNALAINPQYVWPAATTVGAFIAPEVLVGAVVVAGVAVLAAKAYNALTAEEEAAASDAFETSGTKDDADANVRTDVNAEASPSEPEDPCNEANLASARRNVTETSQKVSAMERNVHGLFVTAARGDEVYAQAFFRGQIPHVSESLLRFNDRLTQAQQTEQEALARLRDLQERCKE